MLMTLASAALAACRLAFWASPTATACVVACAAYSGALRVVALYDSARSALDVASALAFWRSASICCPTAQ